jgi:hypothetical protein
MCSNCRWFRHHMWRGLNGTAVVWRILRSPRVIKITVFVWGVQLLLQSVPGKGLSIIILDVLTGWVMSRLWISHLKYHFVIFIFGDLRWEENTRLVTAPTIVSSRILIDKPFPGTDCPYIIPTKNLIDPKLYMQHEPH